MILELIYYFVPAYAANTLPPLFAKLIPGWDAPIDRGAKLRTRRLLGRNKTWRGMVLGTLTAGLLFVAQQQFSYSSLVHSVPWWSGFLLGAGALIGDLLGSMVKRQAGVKPGKSFFFLDQMDYTLGAFLLTWWILWPGWGLFVILLLFNALLSLGVHYLGFKLGVNKERF